MLFAVLMHRGDCKIQSKIVYGKNKEIDYTSMQGVREEGPEAAVRDGT